MKKTIHLIAVFVIAGVIGAGCTQNNQDPVVAVQDAADTAQDDGLIEAQEQEISDLKSRIAELENKIEEISVEAPVIEGAIQDAIEDDSAPADPEPEAVLPVSTPTLDAPQAPEPRNPVLPPPPPTSPFSPPSGAPATPQAPSRSK